MRVWQCPYVYREGWVDRWQVVVALPQPGHLYTLAHTLQSIKFLKKKLTYVLPIYGTREGVCAQTCLQAIRYMFNNCNRRYENVAHLSYTRIAQDWRSPILRGRCSVKCTQRGPVQARERNNINPREMLGRWRHSRGVKRCPQVKTTTKQSAVMNTPDSKQRVCASCNGRHTLRYWVRIEENSWGSIYGQF